MSHSLERSFPAVVQREWMAGKAGGDIFRDVRVRNLTRRPDESEQSRRGRRVRADHFTRSRN